MTTVKVKKLDERATVPAAGSAYAAGSDLYALLEGDGEVSIPAHHTVLIRTGLAIELPEGSFGAVFARSGLATREGLRPANCVGVIDSDYRGELRVALFNSSDSDYTIHDGDRIAQLMVLPVVQPQLQFVEELDETARGCGGFGSTGR